MKKVILTLVIALICSFSANAQWPIQIIMHDEYGDKLEGQEERGISCDGFFLTQL